MLSIFWTKRQVRLVLYTIADPYEFFSSPVQNSVVPRPARSSNPYDYIRAGYYLDNAALFGGNNNVSFNFNIPSNISVDNLAPFHK